MSKNIGSLLILVGLAASLQSVPFAAADAAQVQARITDDHGKPVADAVVTLMPKDGAGSLPAPAPEARVIDQRDETFVPYVVTLGKGGTVMFRNSDKTRHHVYSFSSTKQFEFLLNPGESSVPVVFDKAGIAAIGCNIHDFMTAFVFVADTPYVAQSDKDGRALVADVRPGSYMVQVLHPLLRPSVKPPAQALDVPDGGAELSASLPLLAPPHRDHEHGLY
jgi:plastocyanin